MKTVLAGLALFAAAGVCTPSLAQSGLTFPMVDTGQTKCYGTRGGASWSCPKAGEDQFGQDANYTKNPPKYQDNADGTVTDLVTGLMWEKDFQANVEWSSAPSMARRANTGGHNDWRVPTIKELYSLMRFDGATGNMGNMTSTPSDAKPYMDTKVFNFEYPTDRGAKANNANRFIDAQYVTSTAYVGTTMGGSPTFFGVNFADGRIKGYPQRPMMRSGGYYLRLVRGNPAFGQNDFVEAGHDIVLDKATGLEWMQLDTGHPDLKSSVSGTKKGDGQLDWVESLAYCETASYGGKSDWRLPNAKELQAILDYTRAPQTTRTAAIDPIFYTTEITDETGKPNFAGYWTSTTHLDGRYPGTDAIVVYFGEALGAFKSPGGGQMGGSMPERRQQNMSGPRGNQGPPPMGGGGGMMPPPHMMGPGGQGGMMPPPHMMGQQGGPQGDMQGGPRGGPGSMSRPRMGGGSGPSGSADKEDFQDVHGAGAQRSDPKVGSVDQYPIWGHGPQGDVRRVFNHVRCVRDAG
ncbi:DUF1566 domain-containing protein [Magnetovibrio sp. PR-2]|uniref:Lcl C-terminal domain-containing protein n=1 Tax=Magnetovibrio sp. PR-2 TaxID=3120356 RepID=UPI002FCDE432